MDNPFTTIAELLTAINSKLDQALKASSTQETELLTKKEYLKKRQISLTTLWREEKSGKIKPIIIGSQRYYKMPK